MELKSCHTCRSCPDYDVVVRWWGGEGQVGDVGEGVVNRPVETKVKRNNQTQLHKICGVPLVQCMNHEYGTWKESHQGTNRRLDFYYHLQAQVLHFQPIACLFWDCRPTYLSILSWALFQHVFSLGNLSRTHPRWLPIPFKSAVASTTSFGRVMWGILHHGNFV